MGRSIRSQATPGAVSIRSACGAVARWNVSIRERASSIARFVAASSLA